MTLKRLVLEEYTVRWLSRILTCDMTGCPQVSLVTISSYDYESSSSEYDSLGLLWIQETYMGVVSGLGRL